MQVRIPRGCLLDPSDTAAVVGGNVLTSQRVVDVILQAFSVCAASQGCTNNITFGDEQVSEYHNVLNFTIIVFILYCYYNTHYLQPTIQHMFVMCVRLVTTRRWQVARVPARRGTAEAACTPT